MLERSKVHESNVISIPGPFSKSVDPTRLVIQIYTIHSIERQTLEGQFPYKDKSPKRTNPRRTNLRGITLEEQNLGGHPDKDKPF
jgi:hypothetical protein